jgi:Fe-S cluster assembly iron-binding protein IscA
LHGALGDADAPALRHTPRMLALTPEAVRAVVEFVVAQDAGAIAGLRISHGPHSAADRTWNYSVEHEPFEGDLVIEDDRARVFVDPDAAMDLEDAMLDAHVDDDTLETRFIVRMPDAG